MRWAKKITKTHYRKSALFAAIALLTSCTHGVGEPEYSCSGLPNGVTCVSVENVYELTHNRDHLEGMTLHETGSKDAGSSISTTTADAATPTPNNRSNQPKLVAPMIPPGSSMPVRTRAIVMRIYIAPYQDEAEDLHMPGLVFTEIEERKWQIGHTRNERPNTLTPLRVDE